MRTISILLAVAFLVSGPSIAGSVDSRLPGAGAFSYTGSAALADMPMALASH